MSPPAKNPADSDHANAPPIDERALQAAAKAIRRELAQRVVSGTCPQTAALDHVLIRVFGEHRSAEERLRFLVFTVPLARRLALEKADGKQRVTDGDASVADVRELFWWCDVFDPLSSRVLDLRYFAGVSARQTARALQIHPRAAVRDLRFAKAFLRIKLDKLE